MKFNPLTHAFHSLLNIANIFLFQIPHLKDWSYVRWIWDFMCWKEKYWKIISASVLCECTYCWLMWYEPLNSWVDKQIFKSSSKIDQFDNTDRTAFKWRACYFTELLVQYQWLLPPYSSPKLNVLGNIVLILQQLQVIPQVGENTITQIHLNINIAVNMNTSY